MLRSPDEHTLVLGNKYYWKFCFFTLFFYTKSKQGFFEPDNIKTYVTSRINELFWIHHFYAENSCLLRKRCELFLERFKQDHTDIPNWHKCYQINKATKLWYVSTIVKSKVGMQLIPTSCPYRLLKNHCIEMYLCRILGNNFYSSVYPVLWVLCKIHISLFIF